MSFEMGDDSVISVDSIVEETVEDDIDVVDFSVIKDVVIGFDDGVDVSKVLVVAEVVSDLDTSVENEDVTNDVLVSVDCSFSTVDNVCATDVVTSDVEGVESGEDEGAEISVVCLSTIVGDDFTRTVVFSDNAVEVEFSVVFIITVDECDNVVLSEVINEEREVAVVCSTENEEVFDVIVVCSEEDLIVCILLKVDGMLVDSSVEISVETGTIVDGLSVDKGEENCVDDEIEGFTTFVVVSSCSTLEVS